VRSRRKAAVALFAALAALGCRTPGAPSTSSLLEPLAPLGLTVPGELERAAHDLAAAALVSPAEEVASGLARIEALEQRRSDTGEAPSGLPPFAQYLSHATLDDRESHRRAALELLRRDDFEPGLRRLLEHELADDPLRLAEARLGDARRSRFARTFNALAAPLGRSLLGASLAPVRLGRALLSITMQQRLEDPISIPERQALAHWKRHLEAHPEEANDEMLRWVESFQARWLKLKRKRNLEAAQVALERQRPALGFALAGRALDYAPEDEEAEQLRSRAEAALREQLGNRRRSLEATVEALPETSDLAARGFALALLLPGADLESAAHTYEEQRPASPLLDVARFARASLAREAGHESAMRTELRALAQLDPRRSFMARHAAALLASPDRNPYDAFLEARRSDRIARSSWMLLGPFAAGPRDLHLPQPLEWLLEAPSFLAALGGMPNRLVRMPWMPPTADAASAHARRYLTRFPQGERTAEVRSWLIDFESQRGNAIEAHRLAEEDPASTLGRVAELAEAAARQGLEIARRQQRRDLRLELLRHTARRYPESEAGREAGKLARQEIQEASAQRIRISRGFLRENPQLAGPGALGLRPELLDGEIENGELHPQGILLLGGRTLEVALVDESGREQDPPQRPRRTVSATRLARIVALLEETALRNARIDRDAELEPDADRDLFFERARLGVTEHPDRRPAAQSTYAFLGMRERYGMVRKRESILPVELVLQGSFEDLGLGAYPRLRGVRPTPDAVLFR
jgi:hypothetical protein